MTLMQVGLDDKYRFEAKRIYLSGVQALVRLPMLQRERDRAAGLNTGGFISGYRGSPLGMYDHTLWRAKSFLQEHDIAFVPGLNEDLAATAVWGSQQVGLFPGRQGRWRVRHLVRQGPRRRPLDRCAEARQLGRLLAQWRRAGARRRRSRLPVLDPRASERAGVCRGADAGHQSLDPAGISRPRPLRLCAVAFFRLLGRLQGDRRNGRELGLDLCRSGSRQDRAADRFRDAAGRAQHPLARSAAGGREAARPEDGGGRRPSRAPTSSTGSCSTASRRGSASSRPARPISICKQAMADLGISDRDAEALGLRIYKVALTWPLEEQGAKRFAEGLQDVLVIEEKRGFIEDQLMRILYNVDAWNRPSVVGKRDESGAPLLPSEGELNPTIVASALVARLRRLGHQSPLLEQRLARLEAFDQPATGHAPITLARTPFFCSGCPHNTSTKLPEGSRAMAGIGCHGMALSIPSRRTATITHMGGEGANWIGQAPFTNEQHIFQNLGDGTYTHSGLLALRAAGASGVNITYKILYNDAVAMTGGQPAEGSFTVAQIAHQVCGRRHQASRDRLRRSRQVPVELLPAGRDRASPPRHGRAAEGAARDQGPHGPDLRPDLRRREAPPPQARALSRSAQARLHQRSRLRRLRRLLADLELRLGAAARHRVRPQAPDRPVELQQGLFLRRRFLPELRHRAWRRAEAAEELGGRFRTTVRRPAAARGPRARQALRHPRHRHRRHRRHHRRRAARHGRPCRRQGLLGARLHRPVAEERRGHEPCPHRREAGGPFDRAHRQWRRRPDPRLRHGGVGRPDRAVARRPRRHEGLRQRRYAADRELRAESRHRLRDRRDADRAARRHRRAQSRDHRRHRHRRDLDGRQHRDQSVHARLRLPEGRDPAVAGGAAARHRDQRRRDRDEQAGLHLGPARRARHVARAEA